jgi:hypothetical protein
MDILRAVLSINPKAELDVYEENIKTINWRGGTEPIPEADILAERDRLQAEYDALAYSRKREAEYPSVQECVHAILDDTLDALQAKRAEIKTKYPKGG